MSSAHRPEVRNSYLAEERKVGVRVGKREGMRVGMRVGVAEGRTDGGNVGMTVGVRELNCKALEGAKVGNAVGGVVHFPQLFLQQAMSEA